MKCQHYVVTHDYNAIYGGIFLPPPHLKYNICQHSVSYMQDFVKLGYVSTSEIGT